MYIGERPAGNFLLSTTMTFRIFMAMMAVLLYAFSAAGPACAGGKSTTITIGGTGGALGGMKEIARAFRKKHPEITVFFIPSLGSGGGIKAVIDGSLDLALSARPLTDREREQGASALEYARTPMVFVTNDPAHAVSLTLRRVASIYAGEIREWPDGVPLRLVLRPEADTDTLFLRLMSPEMDIAVQKALSRQGMLVAITDQENADTLVKVKGSFGVTTLAEILSEKRPLIPLSVDGVAPGIDALAEGRYPFSKVYYAVTAPGNSSATRRFIAYLESARGRSILTKNGHLVSLKLK